MSPFIVFDISDPAALQEVKSEMQKLEYWPAWKANEKTYYLPKNSLWKSNGELQKAIDDLNDVINKLNLNRKGNAITLDRCIALPTDAWAGIGS